MGRGCPSLGGATPFPCLSRVFWLSHLWICSGQAQAVAAAVPGSSPRVMPPQTVPTCPSLGHPTATCPTPHGAAFAVGWEGAEYSQTSSSPSAHLIPKASALVAAISARSQAVGMAVFGCSTRGQVGLAAGCHQGWAEGRVGRGSRKWFDPGKGRKAGGKWGD